MPGAAADPTTEPAPTGTAGARARPATPRRPGRRLPVWLVATGLAGLAGLGLPGCSAGLLPATDPAGSAGPAAVALPADPAADLPAAMLAAHNAARARHGAPPLAWSPDLARFAQSVADRHKGEGCGGLSHSRALDRRAVFSGGPAGENLGAGYASAAAVIAGWMREAADYDYATGASRGGPTGHFTQVVWQGTRAVGCGVAVCPNGRYKTIWACNYGPPGNVRGRYAANVGRPDASLAGAATP